MNSPPHIFVHPSQQNHPQYPINTDTRASKGLSAFFTFNKYWGSGNNQGYYGYGNSNIHSSAATNNLNNNLNQNYNVNYNTFNDDINANLSGGVSRPPGVLSSPVDPVYPTQYGSYYPYQQNGGGTFASGHLVIAPFRKLHNFGLNLLSTGHLYGTGQFFRARDYSDVSKK